MTELVFYTDGEDFRGFKVKGHSGYAEEDSDIVCAAVSACVTLVECAVNDIKCVGAQVFTNEEDAEIRLMLPETCEEREFCSSVIRAFYNTAREYEKTYGKYLRVSVSRK